MAARLLVKNELENEEDSLERIPIKSKSSALKRFFLGQILLILENVTMAASLLLSYIKPNDSFVASRYFTRANRKSGQIA